MLDANVMSCSCNCVRFLCRCYRNVINYTLYNNYYPFNDYCFNTHYDR